MHRHHALRLTAAAIAAAALAAPSAHAATPSQISTSVNRGAAWLKTQQSATTGGFSGFGGDFAVSAMVAADVHAADVRVSTSAPTLQDWTAGQLNTTKFSGNVNPSTKENTTGGTVNEFAKFTLFGYAAGIDTQRVAAQVNTVAQLAAAYKPATGAIGSGLTNTHAFALMALQRAGAPAAVLAKGAGYLKLQQHTDGGYDYGQVVTAADRADASDPDMTGAVIGALCTSGVPTTDPSVANAITWLKGRVQADGAIAGPSFAPKNADTNGWVISGLNGCGIDPQSSGWRVGTSGPTIVDFLLSLQRPTGSANAGAYKYLPTEANGEAPNLYAHQDALRALGGELFSAVVPPRANTANPRFRANAAPAAGTVTPHAIAIDDGAGDVRFCRVAFGVGNTLQQVLTAAQSGTAPAGCVQSFATGGGAVTAVNGKTGTWRLTLAGGTETAASTSQTVAFGDTVLLRRQ